MQQRLYTSKFSSTGHYSLIYIKKERKKELSLDFFFFFFLVFALLSLGLMATFDYCAYTVWPNCTNCQRIFFSSLLSFCCSFLSVSYFCAVLNWKCCVVEMGEAVLSVYNIDKYWQDKLIKFFQTELNQESSAGCLHCTNTAIYFQKQINQNKTTQICRDLWIIHQKGILSLMI